MGIDFLFFLIKNSRPVEQHNVPVYVDTESVSNNNTKLDPNKAEPTETAPFPTTNFKEPPRDAVGDWR